MKKLTQTWKQQKLKHTDKEDDYAENNDITSRKKRLGRLPVFTTSGKLVNTGVESNTTSRITNKKQSAKNISPVVNTSTNSSFNIDMDEDFISAVELMEQDMKTGKSLKNQVQVSMSPLVCSTPVIHCKIKNQNRNTTKKISGLKGDSKIGVVLSQVGVTLSGKRRREVKQAGSKSVRKSELLIPNQNTSLTPSNSPADKKMCKGLKDDNTVKTRRSQIPLQISPSCKLLPSEKDDTIFTAIKSRKSKIPVEMQQDHMNISKQNESGYEKSKSAIPVSVENKTSHKDPSVIVKKYSRDNSVGSCKDQSNNMSEVGISLKNIENDFNVSRQERNSEGSEFACQQAIDAPGQSADPSRLLLSSWGLPEPVLKQYNSMGIKQMFNWQAECLCTGNVLAGGNLVYAAPTSAGKTMVAELLILKRVLETKRKALFILPFVSVTREKMFSLQQLYQDAGIRVSGFMGGYSPPGGFSSVDVAVCTIEKGNSLINRLIEDKKIEQLGIIVVDELHMVGDSHRGYLLELLLTKIAYVANKTRKDTGDKLVSSDDTKPVQIIGMSATLPNLDLLAKWLHADIYRTDYRPVPLTECIKLGTALYDMDMNKVGDINMAHVSKGDEDHIIPLCLETILAGHAVLIFCPTKNWCEKLCETIAREFYHLMKNPLPDKAGQNQGFLKASDLVRIPLDRTALHDVILQLQRTPVGVDTTLGRTVPYGVAFHHAGLTFDERDIIEGAFRNSSIKVLVATSTLSSGVNLPARRVIIRSVMFHGKVIEPLIYKQMAGRAGRKGVDTADLPPVKSCLIRDDREGLSSCMKRAILEIVVSGVAVSPADVAAYASCTMLAASMSNESHHTEDLIEACIDFLQENEFVTLKSETNEAGEKTDRFYPSQLGAAVLASALSPDEGLAVFAELQTARKCFVLESELHVIYLVTPVYSNEISSNIDWYQFYCMWEKLSPSDRRVAQLVGVQEAFIAKAVQGRIATKTGSQMRSLAIHKRFYTSLVLLDLVSEIPLPELVRRYNCNKGQLQSLQQSAATFAGMVTVFCGRLGWFNLELILSQFQNRLTFGVQRELCDLVRISVLNGQRARTLYNGGYETVASLASADIADIENLLKTSAPFQSTKRSDGESEWELEERRKAHCIWLTGKKGVTELEAAAAIISEAKSIIEEELGVVGIQWKTDGQQEETTPERVSQQCFNNRSSSSGQKTKITKNMKFKKTSSNKSVSPGNVSSSSSKVKSFVSEILSPPAAMKKHLKPNIQSPLSGDQSEENLKLDNLITSAVLEPDRMDICNQQIPEAEGQKMSIKNILFGKLSEEKRDTDKQITNSKIEKIYNCSVTEDNNCFNSENNRQRQNAGKNRIGNVIDDTSAVTFTQVVSKQREHIMNKDFPQAPKNIISDHLDINTDEKDHFLQLDCDRTKGQLLNAEPEINNHIPHDSPEPVKNIVTATETTNDNLTEEMFSESFSSLTDLENKVCIGEQQTKNSLTKKSSICIVQDEFTDSFEFNTQISNEVNGLANKHQANCFDKTMNKCSEISPDIFKDEVENPGNNKTDSDEKTKGKMSFKSKSFFRASFANNSISSFHDSSVSSLLATSNYEKINHSTNVFTDSTLMNNADTSYAELRIPDRNVEGKSESPKSIPRVNIISEISSMTVNKNISTTDSLSHSLNNAIVDDASVFSDGEDKSLSHADSWTYSMMEKVLDQFDENNHEEEKRNHLNINSVKKVQQHNKEFYLSPDLNMAETAFVQRGIVQSSCLNSSDINTGTKSDFSDSVDSLQNISTDSECLPPTPPEERKIIMSPCLRITPARKTKDKTQQNETSITSTKQNRFITNQQRKSEKTISSKDVSRCLDQKGDNKSNVDEIATSKEQTMGSKITPRLNNCWISNKSAGKEDATVNRDEENVQQHPDENKDGFIDHSFLLTQESFTIIDVCADKRLFENFICEWKTKTRFSLCLACEKKPTSPPQPGVGIGGNFIKDCVNPTVSNKKGLDLDDGRVVVGLAISWENRDTYYISLYDNQIATDPNESLAPPPLDLTLTDIEKLKAIKSVLEGCSSRKVTVDMYDVKSQYSVMCRACGILLFGNFQDPRMAYWLLDPEARELNLHGLVTNYIPTEIPLLEGVGGSAGRGSLGLAAQKTGTGRYRATVDSVLTWKLMDCLLVKLQEKFLYSAFSSVEMPALIVMARMDLNGFGFSETECESQKNLMLAKMSALEEQAYQLAGHPFSLSSTDDVSQVLYTELKLPINGDPKAVHPPLRTVGPNRRGKQKTYLSTSKSILEKLKPYHALPGVILEWRRITSAVTKHIFPLQKVKVLCARLDMYRIFSECQFHTATGRVSLSEPNLQNVPKDFEISLPDVIGESPTGNVIPKSSRSHRSLRKQSHLRQEFATGRQVSRTTENTKAPSVSVSMRHAFIPFQGGVLVAADYSQLELRIIAHLSQDQKLVSILNNGGDVFKMIAAQWKRTKVEEITDEQRQQAKQICYGMLYGIGPKALGEQIEVDENDAAVFMETFKSRYPGLKMYLRKVVEFCRENGFVETITGRRRYLPTIKDMNPHAKAQAERQAVNTTVQGSAADLVKTAMVRIDSELKKRFPDCHFTHRHKTNQSIANAKHGKRTAPIGAFPVLQLHDELIYEVSTEEVNEVTHLIKYEMEHAMNLSVRLPVKVKIGPSWSKLEDLS